MTEKEFLDNQASFLIADNVLFSSFDMAHAYAKEYLAQTQIWIGIDIVREHTLTLANGRIFEK